MYQKQTRSVYSEQATFTVVTYFFTREIYSNHQEQTNQYKTKRNEAKQSEAIKYYWVWNKQLFN